MRNLKYLILCFFITGFLLHSVVPAYAANSTYLYGDSLTGEAKTIYELCKQTSAANNTISFDIVYDSDNESYTKVKERVQDEISLAIAAYQKDYPEKVRWMNGNKRYSIADQKTYIHYELELVISDYYSASEEKKLEAKIDQIIQKSPSSSRYQKLEYIHDWIVKNTTYKKNTDSKSGYRQYNELGCIMDGHCVCSGYSKAFKVLCDEAGIPCILDQSANHMWTYVQMENGNWYLVDPTWDDPIGGTKPVYYNYFLVASDAKHVSNTGFKIPSIAASKYSSVAAPSISSVSNSKDGIVVKWKKSSNASGYYIYRKTTGNWTRIAAVKKGTTVSYIDKTAKAGTAYTHTVKAYNSAKTSSYNKTGKKIKRLTQPSVTLSNITNGVKISWKKVTGASKYRIYYQKSGKWVKLTDTTATSYVDTSVSSRTSRTYTVKAISGDYSSSYCSGIQ